MKCKVGNSQNKEVKVAVEEATRGVTEPKLILFFSGKEYFKEYTEELYQKFPKSNILGVTSFAMFSKSGAPKKGIVVAAIEEGIECVSDVLLDIDKFPVKYTDRIKNCVNQFKDTKNTVCLAFTSALKSSEELVLSTLNSVLETKNIPLCGSSSGDDGTAVETFISRNGVVYDAACVFVIIKNLGGKIRTYRENIYKPTNHYFTATKVDVRNRIVQEYNHKPAAKVMAEALNTTVAELPKYRDTNPIGRIIGKDIYITANREVIGGNALAYHARVYENARMVLLEPDDYKEVIKKTLEKVHEEMPHPSFCFVVHCLARSIQFEGDGYLDDFGRQLGNNIGEYIGCSGYGEQLGHHHFNQTMVIMAFE